MDNDFPHGRLSPELGLRRPRFQLWLFATRSHWRILTLAPMPTIPLEMCMILTMTITDPRQGGVPNCGRDIGLVALDSVKSFW